MFMHNEIWSPPIDLATDITGEAIPGSASRVYLEFDVYRDLPPDQDIYYSWDIRSIVDGCARDWQTYQLYQGDQKDWFRHVEEVSGLIAQGATQVQIALKAIVMDGTGGCHSHAPLFDNVRLIRTDDGASAVPKPHRKTAILSQNHPNPFNPQTTIAFEIPGRQEVSLRVFDLSGRLVRDLIVGELRYPGRHEVVWNGRDDAGRPVASGTYFYRLEAGDFAETKRMVLIK